MNVYLHFAFRRAKSSDKALFSVAIFKEAEGRVLVAAKTVENKIWDDNPYILAIQSYDTALFWLYRWQNKLLSRGVKNVVLVTNNSILKKWIVNPNRGPRFQRVFRNINSKYCVGGPKELKVGVCVSKEEIDCKAYKFCNRKYLENDKQNEANNLVKEYKSIYQVLEENDEIVVDGMDLELI